MSALSGLEQLQRIASGDAQPPPAVARLGVDPLEIAPGRATIPLQPANMHDNGSGVVHGGVLAGLLDTAMACAVQSLLLPGQLCTTAEFKTTFLRALPVDGDAVKCAGTVRKLGTRVAFAEGEVTDAAGRVYATASATCLVLDARMEPTV